MTLNLPWRRIFSIVCFLLAGLSIFQLVRQDYGNAIETDVSAFLPSGDSESAMLARSLINETQGKVVYATLDGLPTDTAQIEAIQDAVLKKLASSPIIESTTIVDNTLLEETFRYVSDNKLHLLFPKWLAQKRANFDPTTGNEDFYSWAAKSAISDLEAFFESPEAMQLSESGVIDPLLLNVTALKTFAGGQTFDNSSTSIKIWIRISAPPLDKTTQESLQTLASEIEQSIQTISPEANFTYGGLIRLAGASRERIHSDIVKINVISIIGVLLTSALLINRPWHLIKALPTIAFAFLGSISACFYFFGSVHVISLVIGSILTGISIDYAFHMLFESDSKVPTRKLLFFACLSTIAGAITLSSSDLMLIRQVGVFTSFGLLFAFSYSQTLSKTKCSRSKLFSSFNSDNRGIFAKIVLPIILISSLFGATKMSWYDDVRLMEAADPQLTKQDIALRKEFGSAADSQVFLATGSSYLEALKHGNDLIDSISQRNGSLEIFAPSNVFSNSGEIGEIVDQSDSLENFFNSLKEQLSDNGYDTEAFGDFFDDANTLARAKITATNIESKLGKVAATIHGPLEGILNNVDSIFWCVISVRSDAALSYANNSHVSKLSNLEFINNSLNHYRTELIRFGLIAMGIIASVILLSFGFKSGIIIISIPTISVALALCTASLFTEDLNIFHATGAFLAMALAFDYALFATNAIRKNRRVPFSVFLSAATTTSSFFALTLSAIPVVKALGLVVMITTLTAVLLIQCYANTFKVGQTK